MEIKRTPEFREWLDGLRDVAGRARIQARIGRLAAGNPGDHRNLDGGLSEMRVDVGPGYRVYYTRRGDVLIVLLVGGDKASQKQDIRKAQGLAANL
jgi:putative addiction module killer protein